MKAEQISAFPEPFVNHPNLDISHTEGMTLRDYFAGQFLSSVAIAVAHDDKITYDNVAEECYKIADAMLKQRELIK